jgi:tetratricopeptide (TPR) repeat protein
VRELDPTAVAVSEFDLGQVRALQGDFDAAVREWEWSLELDPSHYSSLLNLGNYYCSTGELERGLSLLERARAAYPDTPSSVSSIAHCYAASGAEREARSHLRELEAWSEREYVDPVNMALVHVALGEADEAFEWLERAYAVRAFMLVNLRKDPHFAPLRSDPRFEELWRRTGLPESRPESQRGRLPDPSPTPGA